MSPEPAAIESFDVAFETLLITSTSSRFGFAFGHVRLGAMEVYIRIGKRMVGDTYEQAISLVSFVVAPAHQRQGLFSMVVARIRRVTDLPLFVDGASVDFAKKLLAKGWTQQRANIATIDLFRRA